MQMSESEFFADLKYRLDYLKKQELMGVDIHDRNLESSYCESEIDPELDSILTKQGLVKKKQQIQNQNQLSMKLKMLKNVKINFKELRIQDFEILSTLGTGTFGRVRQAKIKGDPENKVYALKILKKTEVVRLNQVEHIKSEKDILTFIEHPFIVKMKTSFQDQFYIYMLFEYIQGGELFSRLRKEGRFANDVCLFYATEILTAIIYMHKMQIKTCQQPRMAMLKLLILDLLKRQEMGRHSLYVALLSIWLLKSSKAPRLAMESQWISGLTVYYYLKCYQVILHFMMNEPIGIYKKILSGLIEFPKFFDNKVKDLIRKLLNPEIQSRLGFNDNQNGESIKKHKWYRGVDWTRVENRQIPPPWVPYLRSEDDVFWFEKYPDSTDAPKQLPRELQHMFDDF
ncbi:unnamed protein product (macronuclear) [Paramecium tetraurelia]|uniref:Protein kinase domain-containing protein n=1 Tax=Paramecium tetraurelia TaxID=5888 RepID=A0DC35_PARTE|nr:uncharacterized protein GSPATT00015479001 [Paramecium tetraurelia]CAK80602.1 unnamed protein product [Paramecium tetraurelia]|eukprot:XP_001447999.1 hypothetical protein (macronuclear) [Paramecium tetraurelia strain d4-2]